MAPNHRANDVIVLEGKTQMLAARFMYGPLDVVSLSGEKVSKFFIRFIKNFHSHVLVMSLHYMG